MLRAQRFGRKQFSLLDVMWPQSKQWEHMLSGRNFQLYNKSLCHVGAGKWNDRHSVYIVWVESWWWHCKWRLVDWVVSFVDYWKLEAIFKIILGREIILSLHVDLSEDVRIITDFLVNFLKPYPPNVTMNIRLRRPFECIVSSNALLKTCSSYTYIYTDRVSKQHCICLLWNLVGVL